MYTQAVLTVSESKRLIAKGIAKHPDVLHAMEEGTVVVCKGSTNAYVVEELLGREIARTDYVTGKTVPAKRSGEKLTSASLPDVVLRRGQPVEGADSKSIVSELKPGDVFIKGANALNYELQQAALLIGHPTGGTIGAAIGTLVARRVKLLVPVGLEKNVPGDLNAIADVVASFDEMEVALPALWPVAGEIFTEIEAYGILTGCEAMQVAAGGIAGAEGAVWLFLQGDDEQVKRARELTDSIHGEPPFIRE